MTKSKATQPTNTNKETNTMKKVNLSTAIQSNIITFFVTLVLSAIVFWFLYGGIHQDARADVVNDIQMVQTTTKK